MIAALEEEGFQEISWRNGTQGPLLARFAAMRLRMAEGPRVEGQALPGAEVLWLVYEWRNTGEKKYYLGNHAPNTTLGHWRATSRRGGAASRRMSS